MSEKETQVKEMRQVKNKTDNQKRENKTQKVENGKRNST
jgi:hypothetical protein